VGREGERIASGALGLGAWWIDESKIAWYKKIVTDDAGFIVKEFSLARMLETCTDFANEKTQLEFVCQSLGTEALKQQSTMPSRQERALNILGEQQKQCIDVTHSRPKRENNILSTSF
jgi:hypothetical protein